jgi:non-specific serine/threonine protein kinase
VESCAAFVDAVLQGSPNVRVLTTSREALGVVGEVAWHVSPLALPEAEAPDVIAAVMNAEAGRLFLERARDHVPGFELDVARAQAVAAICQRLNGLPLAIELAAAWLPVLTPEQIADRLDATLELLVRGQRTAPSRQQTLRGTLDWSYQLLSAPEQVLLEEVSVFAGGWSLEAAQAVCGAELHAPAETLTRLARLVDTSLVQTEPIEGTMRYRLLEPVRQYAAAALEARGQASAVRRRHAEYYASWVRQLGQDLRAGSAMERRADSIRSVWCPWWRWSAESRQRWSRTIRVSCW